MKRSLRLLTSGILGFNSSSASGSSSGRESKNQRSELKTRIISRLQEAMAEVKDLGKSEKKLIIGLVTQALDTTPDERIIDLVTTAQAEFSEILAEFGGKKKRALQVGAHTIRAVEFVDE
jgi:hypothetical protein